MLPATDYDIVTEALKKAASRIQEIRDFVASLSPDHFAYAPNAERADRLERYHNRLQASYKDLHSFSRMFNDISFADQLTAVIQDRDMARASMDRAFFGEIHADLSFRQRFFMAMDDLAAANDNPFSARTLKQIKERLMALDYLDNRAITNAVWEIKLGNQNVDRPTYARRLITLLDQVNGKKTYSAPRLVAA